MSRFFEHWETNYSRFDSADTSEQIKAIVDFHHQLLAIHPFENGNGRVARAISDLQIQKCFRVNRKLNLKDSENYYSSLSIADGGNMDAMFRLFESLLYPQ
jgi:Fic family protein